MNKLPSIKASKFESPTSILQDATTINVILLGGPLVSHTSAIAINHDSWPTGWVAVDGSSGNHQATVLSLSDYPAHRTCKSDSMILIAHDQRLLRMRYDPRIAAITVVNVYLACSFVDVPDV